MLCMSIQQFFFVRGIVIEIVRVLQDFQANYFLLSHLYFTSSNTTGHWSTEGCRKDEQLSSHQATVCHCNHLTHFVVLMRVTDKKEVQKPY